MAIEQREPSMAAARRLAREQKLHGIRYLDAEGNDGARGDKVTHVELTFSNMENVRLTVQEMSMLKEVHFDLRRKP